MGFDQFIAHSDNIIDGKLGAGMRIQHDRLIDGLFSAGHRCLYRHQLHIDVRSIEGCTLLGKVTDIARLHAVTVDQTGDFHTGVGRQVGDQTIVQYVAADFDRLISFHRFHNIACVFFRAGMGEIRIGGQLMAALLPVFNLPDASAGIFIQRDAVAIDQFRILSLDKIRGILRRMLAGLCDIISESAHQLQSDHIMMFPFRLVEIILFSCLRDPLLIPLLIHH